MRVGAFALAHAGLCSAVVGMAEAAGAGYWPVLIVGNAAIIVDGTNLRVLAPGLAAAQPPLRCLALDGAKPVREAVTAGIPALTWSTGKAPNLAAARHGPHLVLAIRGLTADTPLRLAEAGGPIALDASRAMVNAAGTRLAIPGGWSLAEHWTMPDPSGGPAIAISVWAPLPSRAPGTPVAVLMGDHPVQPWWLAGAWTRLTDTP